jgi:hypothetical protein
MRKNESATNNPPVSPDIVTPKDLNPFVAFLLAEWRVLKRVSFYIAVGIAAIPIAWFWKTHYQGVIEEKDAKIARIAEERDGANRRKDELTKEVDGLRIYRQSDIPLKKKGLVLSAQINEFTKTWKDTDDTPIVEQNLDRYLDRFGLRVRIIRDDLDQAGQQSDEFDKVLYHFDMKYKDVRTIASEVEKLSKNLPD